MLKSSIAITETGSATKTGMRKLHARRIVVCKGNSGHVHVASDTRSNVVL